jgi:hypothetical protein
MRCPIHPISLFHALAVKRLVVAGSCAALLALFALGPHIAVARELNPTWNPSNGMFEQTATVANTYADSTFIDNAAANGNQSAMLFVTPNYNPSGSCGCVYNDHPVGVWYSNFTHRWAIFNVDLAPTPIGVSFNIMTSSALDPYYIGGCHKGTATASSPTYNYFVIPPDYYDATYLVFVIQDWTPTNVIDPDAVGVWWDATAGLWAVFNENPSVTMTPNATFDWWACEWHG